MLTNKKGSTFIELMIAMVIVSMTFLAATSLSIMSTKLNARANTTTDANKSLVAFVEQMRGKNAFHLEEGSFIENFDGYEISYSIERIHQRLCRIEASTEVRGVYSRGRRVSVATMLNNMWGPDIGSHIVVVN